MIRPLRSDVVRDSPPGELPEDSVSITPSESRQRAPEIQTLQLLSKSAEQLSLASDISQITQIAALAIRQLTQADGSTVVLRDGDQSLYAAEDSFQPLWLGQRIPLASCISGWAIMTNSAINIPDIYQDSRISQDFFRTTYVRSLAIVPIRTREPLGALGIYWAAPYSPPQEHLQILQTLAHTVGLAIDNVRIRNGLAEHIRKQTESLEAVNQELRVEATLRKQMEAKIIRLSHTDELTSLNNRRGFLLRAEQLLKLAHRVNAHAWMIYVDLDGLKQSNDNQGHEAGDRLIQAAAKTLRESFRDSDVIGRIGGDEFVVFTIGASTPISELQDRLHRNIAHYNRCYADQTPLSVSVGVIRCDPHSPHSLQEMIHQADAAMYIEKRRKRTQSQDLLES